MTIFTFLKNYARSGTTLPPVYPNRNNSSCIDAI